MGNTLQFKILTGLKLSGGKWNNINIFYKADLEYVKNNFLIAKKNYPDLFRLFVSSYIIGEANKLSIHITDIETIKKAIGDGRIKPISGYNKLKKLEI